ncbi:MAG: hypothetical protein EP150_11460 [Prevotella copri]|nr:hypothetical protein [Segatella copri]
MGLHSAEQCGFCATSNEVHIIDDDENRRFLIWRIEKIKSPIDFPSITRASTPRLWHWLRR